MRVLWVRGSSVYCVCGVVLGMVVLVARFFRSSPVTYTSPLQSGDVGVLDFACKLSPHDPCPPGVRLVALAYTAAGDTRKRTQIRSTWASAARGAPWPRGNVTFADLRVYFLLGSVDDEEVNAQIFAEYEEHGDIIQYEFIDSYANLTIKTLAGITWMTSFCGAVQFLLKVDADMFINVPALMDLVANGNSLTNTVIGGRIAWREEVKRAGRHAVPHSLFPSLVYPPYAVGPVYLLPRDLLPRLLATAHHLPPLPIEDAWVTGVLRLAIGAEIRQEVCLIRGHCPLEPAKCAYAADSADSMQVIWRQLGQGPGDPAEGCPWMSYVARLRDFVRLLVDQM